MDGNFVLNLLIKSENQIGFIFVIAIMLLIYQSSSSSKKVDEDQEINSENKKDGE